MSQNLNRMLPAWMLGVLDKWIKSIPGDPALLPQNDPTTRFRKSAVGRRRRRSRYTPHQGEWEAERRRLRAAFAWPMRFEIGDNVTAHAFDRRLTGQIEAVRRGGDLHVVRLHPDSEKLIGHRHIVVRKRQLVIE